MSVIQPKTNEDPLLCIDTIKQMLSEVEEQANRNLEQVSNPQAEALFETTIEVINGLINTYNYYGYES
jgi:hypothetical protein